ncbi:MAG: TlpA family protein disulfide reductase [Halobacteriovoraceae bacterium]|jgi:thiol-disulfide isomerase/thioredoxin|nr:TlpA family protein disulfide reductase [Halobacteriovoraceae bacterium]
MKKFFPAIILSLIFTVVLVSQMLINGQELSASRTEKNKERFTVYETQFSKLTKKTTKGELINLKSLKEPIVIVNFWASWCRPCISEFKTLNKLIKKFKNKVFVLGINNDTEEALKSIKKVEQEYKLAFNSISDIEGSFAASFNVTKLPSSVIYHKGKVIKFVDEEFDFMSKKFISLISDKINSSK